MLFKLYSRLLILCLFSCLSLSVFSQSCPPGEVEIEVVITTDIYGYETGWQLKNGTDGTIYKDIAVGSLASSTTITETVCVPDSACLQFTIFDDYGDGIFSPGGYDVYRDGVLQFSGGSFAYFDNTFFNCGPGQSCESAIPVTEGSYTAPTANSWYSFVPDSVGTYLITTCGMNSCNTVLWVYDNCEIFDLSAMEEGTIYFNDDNGSCGLQAEIPDAILLPGTTYYIRIGDVAGDCGGGPINWSISYNGPVSGCTDSLACNYNPLATLSDTCIYPGSPDCPDGPDLVIDQGDLETSMYIGIFTVTSTYENCLVSEECLTGFGTRTLIRFDTKIKNIGNTDYYIGNPSDNPDQFDLINCHNHTHYKGYAEYLLYDSNGVETPVGFKNGFCVMDITCEPGYSANYGCGTMGISEGCADIYGSGTTCNWIDITNVTEGRYTFVARTNWDKDPDALGRHELDYNNNWAQVCLYIGKTPSGSFYFNIDSLCDPYVDCLGEVYGDAQPDCLGVCNGPAQMGDLNFNGIQETVDVEAYVSGILGDDLPPTSCNDLNQDGLVNVYDAALLNNCLLYNTGHAHDGGSVHDHCDFPDGLDNPTDTAWLSIADINFDDNYVDIAVRNPYSAIKALEFEMSGLEILSIETLADSAIFPSGADYSLGGQRVIGLSRVDSAMTKVTSPQQLFRIKWFSLTASEVCVSNVEAVVNQGYESIIGLTEDACRPVTATGLEPQFNPLNVQLYPNPASDQISLNFSNPTAALYRLEIYDAAGRLLQQLPHFSGSNILIEREGAPAGLYQYKLLGPETISGSFVWQ